ncbi:MAG TPA: SGNH/GDSL hydrolase family protein [Fimbriimonadaceae bacterium]|jgi:lysophospholipase L1-like esterase
MLAALASLVLSPFFLKPGDRVVFYGDSITEQQFYTTEIEAFVRTRYPKMDTRFWARGWSGDATWGGGGGTPDQRVSRDVKPLDPTVVTVMLGMNDGGYVPYDQKIYDTFNDWYGKLIGYIKRDAPKARVTLIRTSPWDDIVKDNPPFPGKKWAPWHGYNDTLVRYGKVVLDQAKANHYRYVDFNQPLVSLLISAKAKDAALADKIIPDGIHPSAQGHFIMAETLLRSWGAGPVVSSVDLDFEGHQVDDTNAAHVSDFRGLSWSCLEHALPCPIDFDDKLTALVMKISNFVEDLDREMLRVENLPAGSYSLKIDGEAVGSFSNMDLQNGVNLAVLPTPMVKQSLSVLAAVKNRSHEDFVRWRGSDKEKAAVSETDDQLNAAEVKLAQPIPHKFELVTLP